ncbi:MAG TPA: hypothetical protein VM029_03390, partial [Opitutaceae bacterium]|nr:hypothetical protein [Opitutaceae bacterium]
LDVVAISETLPDGPLSSEGLRAGVRAAQAQVEQAIRNSLGNERYAVYRDYERTLAHRETVAQLEQRLSYGTAPLTPAQGDALVRILVASTPAETTGGPAVSIVLAASGTTVPILQATAPAGRVTDEGIAQAQAVLTPVQLTALRDLQVEQQAAARAAELVRLSAPRVSETAGVGLSLFLQ